MNEPIRLCALPALMLGVILFMLPPISISYPTVEGGVNSTVNKFTGLEEIDCEEDGGLMRVDGVLMPLHKFVCQTENCSDPTSQWTSGNYKPTSINQIECIAKLDCVLMNRLVSSCGLSDRGCTEISISSEDDFKCTGDQLLTYTGDELKEELTLSSIKCDPTSGRYHGVTVESTEEGEMGLFIMGKSNIRCLTPGTPFSYIAIPVILLILAITITIAILLFLYRRHQKMDKNKKEVAASAPVNPIDPVPSKTTPQQAGMDEQEKELDIIIDDLNTETNPSKRGASLLMKKFTEDEKKVYKRQMNLMSIRDKYTQILIRGGRIIEDFTTNDLSKKKAGTETEQRAAKIPANVNAVQKKG